eukprot:429325-Pleurochrysis_carterae.AAC.2
MTDIKSLARDGNYSATPALDITSISECTYVLRDLRARLSDHVAPRRDFSSTFEAYDAQNHYLVHPFCLISQCLGGCAFHRYLYWSGVFSAAAAAAAPGAADLRPRAKSRSPCACWRGRCADAQVIL